MKVTDKPVESVRLQTCLQLLCKHILYKQKYEYGGRYEYTVSL
jgi:hypothetical protein